MLLSKKVQIKMDSESQRVVTVKSPVCQEYTYLTCGDILGMQQLSSHGTTSMNTSTIKSESQFYNAPTYRGRTQWEKVC